MEVKNIVIAALLLALTGCGSNDYQVGGEVTGLDGTTEFVDLELMQSQEQLRARNGDFAFDSKLEEGSPYDVRIKFTPPAALCEMKGGKGVVDSNSINAIDVNCKWVQQQIYQFGFGYRIDAAAVDPSGNYVVAARSLTSGPVKIRKYDSSGYLIWEYPLSDHEYPIVTDIELGGNGDVYLALYGLSDNSERGFDSSVLGLSSEGGYLWSRTLGGSADVRAQGLYVTESDIIVSGYTSGSGDYEGLSLNGSRNHYFVSRLLKSTGGAHWHRIFGEASDDEYNQGGVVVDQENRVVVTYCNYGYFGINRIALEDGALLDDKLVAEGCSTGNIGHLMGEYWLTGWVETEFLGMQSISERDAFLIKLDDNLNPVWFDRLGTKDEYGNQIVRSNAGVELDSSGNATISGTVLGSLPGSQYVYGGDIFITQWSNDGSRRFLRQLGTYQGEDLVSLKAFPNGTFLALGWTGGDYLQGNMHTPKGLIIRFDPSDEGPECIFLDTDLDGICDYLDSDDDNDTTPDDADVCPLIYGTDDVGC